MLKTNENKKNEISKKKIYFIVYQQKFFDQMNCVFIDVVAYWMFAKTKKIELFAISIKNLND